MRALPETGRDHQHSELARITGIPRSSVHRLMTQLEAVGAVERLADGRYVPATPLSEIDRRADPHAALRTTGLEMMHALRGRTGATISLVVPAARGYTALEVVPGRVTLPTPIHSGIAMPSASAAAPGLRPQRGTGAGQSGGRLGQRRRPGVFGVDLLCIGNSCRRAYRGRPADLDTGRQPVQPVRDPDPPRGAASGRTTVGITGP
ncbi:helix-turn-helix domain-containing protein [Mycobacterium interjectum]|nr:helix-turn-helix domain-containing protein [Mycobacterium interjectum]